MVLSLADFQRLRRRSRFCIHVSALKISAALTFNLEFVKVLVGCLRCPLLTAGPRENKRGFMNE